MSDIAANVAAESAHAPSEPSWQARALARLEDGLAALTDRANPILVKETRQALKSRQFIVSFLVVLVGCWIVTLAGVAVIGPEIYFGAAGPEMLLAYYCVLAAPLAVIVPYSAYRSLAAEKEENTYDLLSITTLGSRQIVTGKLCSAAAQMFVYFSAVAPCIVFTLLLRGVDAMTVAALLVLAVAGSLALSMAALLVGTLSQVRYTQAVLSVALVMSLLGAFWGAVVIAYVCLFEEPIPFGDPETWLVSLLLLTLYVTTFGLFHAAASARIAFPSENRSTPLRWWMTVQQACFVAWFAGLVAYMAAMMAVQGFSLINDLSEMLMAVGVVGLLYWYVMGTLMTSEWPHLSRRVQRSLPQSTAGRMFLSLFNPGPGAGYLFAVSNFSMMCICSVAMLIALTTWYGGTWGSRQETSLYFFVISWGYLAGFLGAGRLLISLFRRFAFVPLAAGFLTHFILLLAGIGIPLVIYLMSPSSRYFNTYSLSQITNPMITLVTLVDDGPDAIDALTVSALTTAAGVVMLLLNARSVAAELHRQRTPAPIRVIEEDAEAQQEIRKPQSPWDEDEAAASAAVDP
ncbi:MAG: hypothetical protein CMJ58_09610 [Planctomycetaceae bacterium]|nr:hypothetical protein [Planctomycetaceae bacterium]